MVPAICLKPCNKYEALLPTIVRSLYFAEPGMETGTFQANAKEPRQCEVVGLLEHGVVVPCECNVDIEEQSLVESESDLETSSEGLERF